ncbi:MAG: MFS transporter [Candidatus Limiplasma sp.]|nr:MFS transporter [Candidatus Limiplasma sp.]
MRGNYQHTLVASYIGYITQAIVNNFAPLLFLTFQNSYQLPLSHITSLVTVNFLVQLLTDMAAIRMVDRIGYRPCIVAAHLLSATGILGLALFPALLGNAYAGLLMAVICYAVGGGLLEVLVSPIVEACPTANKSAAMSLLHSFYCWGHAFVVVASTVFFAAVGIAHWRVLAVVWAAIPLGNAVFFTRVPIAALTQPGEGMSLRGLFKERLFWLFLLLMICAGASEQAVSQWSSAFAEAGLRVPKMIGDLAGPCLFALLMGLARLWYARNSERVPLYSYMLGSILLCVAGYLLLALSPWPVLGLVGCGLCGLSVGILWPGVFSLCAGSFPLGGTAMFAILALGGDLGCSAGPTVVGLTANASPERLPIGILTALVFPALFLVGLLLLRNMKKRRMLPPQS